MVRRMTARARPSPIGPTRLVGRMADVLAIDGAPYPMAGALAAAVRGSQQLDRSSYAKTLGLDIATVDAAESGHTPLRELPDPIAERILWLGLDLTTLAADPAA